MTLTSTAPDLTFEGTSRTVQTANWGLHYNEAGTGHPVILLHGSGAGATGWSNFWRNIGPLSEHFRVLAVDMPGWGRSDAVAPEDNNHVSALVEFMDALGIEKAALVGNSMGGVTVMAMAVQHPERVSHVITMGSGHMQLPTLFSPQDGLSEGLKILFEGYQNPTPETMRKLVEIMTFDKANATEELARQRSQSALARPEHLANFLASIPGGGPVRWWFDIEEVRKVTAPTLLIHGRDDRVVPMEQSLHFLARIPNSRAVIFNQCGHWAMIEHADEFNRLVTDFIAHS
jgi:2-hydroxy-6-oxonona-2,4-dienedioate hydrolase